MFDNQVVVKMKTKIVIVVIILVLFAVQVVAASVQNGIANGTRDTRDLIDRTNNTQKSPTNPAIVIIAIGIGGSMMALCRESHHKKPY